MLNSYYAEILDVTEADEVVLYGYTFRDKNIREAKLHAAEVARQINAVPLASVWRISREHHWKLADWGYTLPRPVRINGEGINETA